MLNKRPYLTKNNVLLFGIKVRYRSLMGKEVPHVTTKARGCLTAQPPKEQTTRGIRPLGKTNALKILEGLYQVQQFLAKTSGPPLALLMKIKNK